MLGEHQQQVRHGLRQLHDGGVEEGPLQVVRLLRGRQARRERHPYPAEPVEEVGGQAQAAAHVPQARALERADDVVRVGRDQVAGAARAGLGEDELVRELRPQRHHQVPQPDQAAHVRQGPGRAAAGQLLGPGARHREQGAGHACHGLVPLARLQVLLVHLGAGRQPVPEQVRQRRPLAAPAGGRMRVDLPEPLDPDQVARHRDALLAVDPGEHTAPQRHDPARHPPWGGWYDAHLGTGAVRRAKKARSGSTCTSAEFHSFSRFSVMWWAATGSPGKWWRTTGCR